MKKTFELAHPKIKPARMVEAIKHETKKYLKRERKKKLPDDAGFWDFDCRFGAIETSAEDIHVTEINQKIDQAVADGLTSFYLEILAKPGKRKGQSQLTNSEQSAENVESADISASSMAKWGEQEIKHWFSQQRLHRSYLDTIVDRLEPMQEQFEVEQYGALSHAPTEYPLYCVKSRNWSESKKTILITGGVHGYETSGVLGALCFLEQQAIHYAKHFNIVVAPCVSPWGFETINRWNPDAVDPNRSFYPDTPSEESASLMEMVASLNCDIFAHFDLHETTDTDNTVFRPALAARDGVVQDNWNIPDGFYTVGDSDNPVEEFQRAIISRVKGVTHIADPDESGNLIGKPMTQPGVINYPTKELHLCTGFSDSQFSTTTEVYPDSQRVSEQDCIKAQVAAITGGLDYLIENCL